MTKLEIHTQGLGVRKKKIGADKHDHNKLQKNRQKISPDTAEPSTSPSPHCPFPVPTLQVLQSAVLLSGRKSSGHNTFQTVHLSVDLVSMHHQSFATHYKYLNKVQHMQCLSIPVVITHSELWMLQPSAYPCFLGHKECIEGHMSRHWPAWSQKSTGETSQLREQKIRLLWRDIPGEVSDRCIQEYRHQNKEAQEHEREHPYFLQLSIWKFVLLSTSHPQYSRNLNGFCCYQRNNRGSLWRGGIVRGNRGERLRVSSGFSSSLYLRF